MKDSQTRWDDDLDKELMRLIVEGYSYSKVAAKLGLSSRNAVAGRCHRLREMGHTFKGPDQMTQALMGVMNRKYRPGRPKGCAPNPPKPREPREPKPRKERVMSKTKPVADRAVEARIRDKTTGKLAPDKTPPKIVRLEGSPEPVTILELRRDQCRAAVGHEPARGFGVTDPFRFCGMPAEEGEAYCEAHGRLMYQTNRRAG